MAEANEIDQALRAGVWRAMKEFPVEHCPTDLLEDCLGDAWLTWLSHPRQADDEIGLRRLAMSVGRQVAINRIMRKTPRWSTNLTAREQELWQAAARAEEREGLSYEISERLYAHFLKQRKRGGKRTQDAAARDLAIIQMVTEGYTNEGIAHVLGLSPNSIPALRKLIRRALRKLGDS